MLDSRLPLESSPQVRIVLLHGAGLGPWIWEPVREWLPGPCVALEVPSRRIGTSPSHCAIDLLSHPEFPGDGPVVLVLHSLAGVLESALVSALGDRLRQVVHLASVVPKPGSTFASTMGFPTQLVLRLLFRFHPRGLAPSPAMILDELGGGLSLARRTELVAKFRPELPGLFLQRVADLSVHPRRTYVRCTRDRSVPPALQERIARRLDAKIVDLDSGHLPMLADPEALARILLRALDDEPSAEEVPGAPLEAILR